MGTIEQRPGRLAAKDRRRSGAGRPAVDELGDAWMVHGRRRRRGWTLVEVPLPRLLHEQFLVTLLLLQQFRAQLMMLEVRGRLMVVRMTVTGRRRGRRAERPMMVTGGRCFKHVAHLHRGQVETAAAAAAVVVFALVAATAATHRPRRRHFRRDGRVQGGRWTAEVAEVSAAGVRQEVGRETSSAAARQRPHVSLGGRVGRGSSESIAEDRRRMCCAVVGRHVLQE